MGEGAVQLGGEQEVGIHSRGAAHPQLGQLGLDVSVERSIDFNYVEAARHVLEGMLFAVAHGVWIKHALPIFIRPARRADPDVRGISHEKPDWFEGSTWEREPGGCPGDQAGSGSGEKLRMAD